MLAHCDTGWLENEGFIIEGFIYEGFIYEGFIYEGFINEGFINEGFIGKMKVLFFIAPAPGGKSRVLGKC